MAFSKEFTVNVVRPGKTGADEIKQMMTDFRNNPPKELGGSKVVLIKDFQTLETTTADGTKQNLICLIQAMYFSGSVTMTLDKCSSFRS